MILVAHHHFLQSSYVWGKLPLLCNVVQSLCCALSRFFFRLVHRDTEMCVQILKKTALNVSIFWYLFVPLAASPGQQQDFLCLLFCLLKSSLDLYHSSHTTVPIYSFVNMKSDCWWVSVWAWVWMEISELRVYNLSPLVIAKCKMSGRPFTLAWLHAISCCSQT